VIGRSHLPARPPRHCEALDVPASIAPALEVVKTPELEESGNYSADPPNRCLFCKAEPFQRPRRFGRARAGEGGSGDCVYGENLE